MKVNVLGTEYELIESNEHEDIALRDIDGYCDTSTKKCVVDECNVQGPGSKGNLYDYKNQVKRHELIHAFLFESGLEANSWAKNEEIVDWLAIQFPKIVKAFADAECI